MLKGFVTVTAGLVIAFGAVATPGHADSGHRAPTAAEKAELATAKRASGPGFTCKLEWDGPAYRGYEAVCSPVKPKVHVPVIMVEAMAACAPAPAGHTKQACESIYLRPAGSTYVSGPKRVLAFIKDLFHNAGQEAAPHTRAWNEYLRNGFDNEISSPEN